MFKYSNISQFPDLILNENKLQVLQRDPRNLGELKMRGRGLGRRIGQILITILQNLITSSHRCLEPVIANSSFATKC